MFSRPACRPWDFASGFPPHCWAFNYLDMRATLTQEVFNWNYIQKERAAAQSLKPPSTPIRKHANWCTGGRQCLPASHFRGARVETSRRR